MLVEIRSLALRIEGVPVLHDVRLSLEHGQIYGLIGPNGAGKSTTIATVLGLLAPDGGTVRVFGEDPRGGDPWLRERVGALLEHEGLYDWMSGVEYLHFFAQLHGYGHDRPALEECLGQVGLDEAASKRIGSYALGMRQRLGLARALLGEPTLLILDEPTNGLDPRGRREVHDILLNLSASRGVGVLLCTHLLDDVERLCSRVGLLAGGRTLAEGPVSQVVREAACRPRYRLRLAGTPPARSPTPDMVSVCERTNGWCTVELDPGVAPEQAWREFLFLGWPVTEIRRDGGGLEDLYFQLTAGETP
jgi:ABC-2 type transport system ATP-binding protein